MKKVIICGLGAVGMTYAVKLKDCCALSILVDEERLVRYNRTKPRFNGIEQEFKYILPDDKSDADLIIIATKAPGLVQAINYIKNFVTDKTYILSLINGISSEEEIKKAYPQANVIKSYFIGHSAVRNSNSVTQDGVGTIVMQESADIEKFFDEAKIHYEIPDDIDYSMWVKYTLNLFSNQTSAILKMTFGEMKFNKNFIEFAKKIISEVKQVAEKHGISNLENLEKDSLDALMNMSNDGKTSMLQDILANRPTETEIFGGEIIKLGKKYSVDTPYNQVLYDLIRIEETR